MALRDRLAFWRRWPDEGDDARRHRMRAARVVAEAEDATRRLERATATADAQTESYRALFRPTWERDVFGLDDGDGDGGPA